MLKRAFFLMMGILLTSTIPAGAMMGGHGTGSHGSGGYMTGGHGEMDGTVQTQMNDAMGDHGNHGMNYGNNRRGGDSPMTRSGGMGMDRQTAETMVREHMRHQPEGSWSMGHQIDGGSYYMTDIMGPNGEVMHHVLIDKNTGNIHSLERR